MIKNSPESEHRGNLSQHNKGHIWQTHSKHHTQWWKTESISTKIRNKTRMSTLATIIQHSFGIPSHGNQRRKRNKRNTNWKRRSKTVTVRASPVAQWLSVSLPMQGMWVRALLWEDPTCRGATRPVSHNYWALRVWSLCSATTEAAIVRGPRTAMKSGPRLPQLEKARAHQQRPNAKINK